MALSLLVWMEVNKLAVEIASLMHKSLLFYAGLEMRLVLASQYDKNRTDYVAHSLEMTQ